MDAFEFLYSIKDMMNNTLHYFVIIIIVTTIQYLYIGNNVIRIINYVQIVLCTFTK